MAYLTDAELADTEQKLKDAAAEKGVAYDPSDLKGIVTHVGYDESGSSLDQALQSTLDRYDLRASDTPGQGEDSSASSGISHDAGGRTTGTGGGTGAGTPGSPRDNGAAATNSQLSGLLALLQGMNNQPDVDLSGLTVGDLPTITVPGQDLGPDIDNTLMDAMEGKNADPLNVETYLKDYLKRTAGGASGDSPQYQQSVEQAREALTRGEVAAKNDLGGVLADRGLIGTPGHPEGEEGAATVRAFQPLQATYLDTLRSATVDEGNRADAEEQDALQRATGWTTDQINTKLAAANSAGDRQKMLSDIALSTLDKNMQWNEFIAQFGLDREKVAADIQQGRMDAIGPIINMFLALMGQTQKGYI